MNSPLNRLPYPYLSYPDPLRDAIIEGQQIVGSPMPLVATSALTALSLATAGMADIQRLDFLTSPCLLYLFIVADRNERKSATDAIFLDAVRQFERERREAFKVAMSAYSREKLIFKEKKRALSRVVREAVQAGEDVEEAMQALEEHLRNEPPKPRDPRILYANSTLEALLRDLCFNHRYAGLVAAEGAVILDSRAFQHFGELNDLWDGRSIHVARAASESFTVDDARLTMSIMVQPDIIRQFLGRKGLEFAGSGFRARALWSQPESTQGTRIIVNPNPGRAHLASFGKRIRDMLECSISDAHGAYPERKLLTLSYEAQKLWIQYHNYIEQNVGPFGFFMDVKDGAGKMAENAARMAGMFHLFLGAEGPVSADLMQRAIDICSWHLVEFKRLFGTEAAITQAGDDAVLLEGWLRCNSHRFNVPNCVLKVALLRYGPNALRSKARLDPALNILIAQQKLEVVPGANNSIWVRLNPYFFQNGWSGLFVTG